MDRRTLAAIWLAGIVLMVLLYIVGPQNFIHACEAFFQQFWWYIGSFIDVLMERAFDAVRAAAIALYVVFVVLALLAGRRGFRGGGALFVVSVLFFVMVGTRWYDQGTKWFIAAVVAGVGALVMTNRLLRRESRDPWGMRRAPPP
jgi:hypothetical protein